MKGSKTSALCGMTFDEDGGVFLLDEFIVDEIVIRFGNQYAFFKYQEEMKLNDLAQYEHLKPYKCGKAVYRFDRMSDTPEGHTLCHYPAYPLLQESRVKNGIMENVIDKLFR